MASDYADAAARLATNPSTAFRLLLREHFDQAASGWPEDTRAEVRRVEGGYRLTPRHAPGFVAVGAPLEVPVRDVVVSATFVTLGDGAGGAFGLVVRDQLPGQRGALSTLGRFYVAEIDESGEVAILQRDNDRWQPLAVGSGPTAAPVDAVRNVLTFEAIGTRLTFLLNSVPVASTCDALLDPGGVGVFVGGFGNDVLVERFVVHAFI